MQPMTFREAQAFIALVDPVPVTEDGSRLGKLSPYISAMFLSLPPRQQRTVRLMLVLFDTATFYTFVDDAPDCRLVCVNDRATAWAVALHRASQISEDT